MLRSFALMLGRVCPDTRRCYPDTGKFCPEDYKYWTIDCGIPEGIPKGILNPE